MSVEISPSRSAFVSGSRRILAVRLRRAKAELWVAAAALALVVTDLGQRVLATNDEARFAVLARRILDGGNWLFPQIAGAVYHNKPLLQAWLIALVSWPVGQVTQFTAVLPSALAAIGCALSVYTLGRELFGRDAGRLAALILITTEGVFLHARLPLPDMLMTFFITASMWMFASMLRQPERRTWVAFYSLVGAAFWSKGPAGLLPLAVAVAHALMHLRDGGWRRLRLFKGLVLVTTLVAPWWLAGAGWAIFRHTVVVDQVLWYRPGWPTMRSLTGPLLNSAEILLPWTFVAPWALVSALRFLRGTGAERNKVSFLLEWAAVTLLAVGLSHQQRLRYYLPLVPPVALLLGWWCAGMVVMHRRAGPVPRRAYVALAGIWVVAVVATLARKGHLLPGTWPLPWSPRETLLLSAPLGLMVGALLFATRCRPRAWAFLTACLGSAVLLVAGYHWTVHRGNAVNDYAALRAGTRARPGGTSLVVTWDLPALPVSFYLVRPVVPVDTAAALLRALADHPGAVALVTDARLAGVEPRGSWTPLASGLVAGRPVTLMGLAPPPGGQEQSR